MRLFKKKKKNPNISSEIFHSVCHDERAFSFVVTHQYDHIQECHRNGQFYEIKELEAIRSELGDRPLRIADIGANVGNHTIYFANFLNCRKITPIEPNPEILRTLRCNLGLNWNQCVDPSHLGIALSDTDGYADMVQGGSGNTGASSVSPRHSGSVSLVRGDEIFAADGLDFIKIDVEGHELNVLQGLRNTLDTHRPWIYVETRDDSRSRVRSFLNEFGYTASWEYSRYEGVVNLMMKPD